MRAIGLFLIAVLSASPAAAYDTYDSRRLFDNPIFATPAPAAPADDGSDDRTCVGVEWDAGSVLVVAKVTAAERVHFVKSPHDDVKASSCPAAGAACRKKSYLVPGDLVLVGKTRGDFTCVSYPSPSAKKPVSTEGWLPSAALTPLAPTPSPRVSDWLGSWTQAYGTIEIRRGGIGGRLHVEGIMVVPTARDMHTGAIDAHVNPEGDRIAFLEDGWLPFTTPCDSGCRVRMQRVGEWLIVQDNLECGGAGVSFTGLYRRKP